MNYAVSPCRLLAGLLFALVANGAAAASISTQVVDGSGQAVADAAVYAEAISGQAVSKPQRTADIEQKGRKFLPLMTVIQTGTEISFPNNDTVRHHVYSFSPPKIFELKLYTGTPGNPVVFDKPGSVVIGCNIHDQMVAYIHIVNTPYFGKTDAGGKVRLDGLVAGKYRLKAWHFSLPAGGTVPEKEITLAAGDVAAALTMNLKPGTGTN